MLILTPFSNLIFTFVVVMIVGHDLASAHPHPHRNRSITDSPPMRRSCTSNWAGAVWDNSPGGAWSEVSAYLNAPRAVSAQVPASVWVGIDGTLCNEASFQVGIEAFLVDDGSTQYYAFAQWARQQSYQFDNFPIDSGDIIVITASAYTAASGTATIQSISKNVTVSHTFNDPYEFRFATAEWVVQPFAQDGADIVFGSVGFYNAQATKYDGTTVNGAGADLYNAGSAASVSADVYGTISVYFNG